MLLYINLLALCSSNIKSPLDPDQRSNASLTSLLSCPVDRVFDGLDPVTGGTGALRAPSKPAWKVPAPPRDKDQSQRSSNLRGGVGRHAGKHSGSCGVATRWSCCTWSETGRRVRSGSGSAEEEPECADAPHQQTRPTPAWDCRHVTEAGTEVITARFHHFHRSQQPGALPE